VLHAAPNLLVQFPLVKLTLQLAVDPSKSRQSIPARADGRSQQKPTVDPSKSRRLIPTALVAPAGCFCLERAPPFCGACFLHRLISPLSPLNFGAPALGFRTGPRFSGLGAAVRALLFPHRSPAPTRLHFS
jgi:hypothetical protein